MEEVIYERATTSDLGELIPLMEQQIKAHPIGYLLLERDLGAWAPFLLKVIQFGTIIVARRRVTRWVNHVKVHPVEIVGAIGAVALPHPLGGDLYADEVMFWVVPAHRGGTIGPKLLEALEAWARQKSVRVLKCSSPVGANLGDHYKRLGFVEVETAFAKVL